MFWILKLITTAMGEAMSDAMGGYSPILDGCVCLVLFIATMFLQFRATEYFAPYYWCTVASVAIAGTAFADAVAAIVGLDSPYVVTVPLYFVFALVVFAAWYYEERTLSIHSTNCRRREGFYWWAVVATFSLGTALGDLLAFPPVGLGFLKAFFVYTGIFALGLVMYLFNFCSPKKINPNFIFWYSYIWTRPVGASLIDFISQPFGEACLEPFASTTTVFPATTSFVAPSSTGAMSTTVGTTTAKRHTTTTKFGAVGACPNELSLQFGDWQSSLVTLGVFIVLVAVQTIFKRDIQTSEEQVAGDDDDSVVAPAAGPDKAATVEAIGGDNSKGHAHAVSIAEEAAVLPAPSDTPVVVSADVTSPASLVTLAVAVDEKEESKQNTAGDVAAPASVPDASPATSSTVVTSEDVTDAPVVVPQSKENKRKSRKSKTSLEKQSTEAVFGDFVNKSESAELPESP